MGVLITRPLAQAIVFARKVEALGGAAHVFPSLEITFTPKTNLQPLINAFQADDTLIFISQNAVQALCVAMDEAQLKNLTMMRLVAVGQRTSEALQAFGLNANITPPNQAQNTEGLLQHAALQHCQGQRLFIIRAQSGRGTLRSELIKRGAEVEYITAYHRGLPENIDTDKLIKALLKGKIQAALFTSHDAFKHTVSLLGKNAAAVLLQDVKIIVPSQRVADAIGEQFSLDILLAENASDQAMLAVLNDTVS